MRRSTVGTGRREGFSLPELMVVLALAALLVLALQQALLAARHFYEAQSAATDRNESLRLSLAVLGASLREANVARGDVEILGPRQLRVRSSSADVTAWWATRACTCRRSPWAMVTTCCSE